MKYIVSGTCEQLGMRPRCDPTIPTAPINIYCRVSSVWVFLAMGTALGLWVSEAVMGFGINTMGLDLQHGD